MSARMHEIPIVAIDKQTRAFIDAEGRRFFEVTNDIFTLDGVVEEGIIGLHGSGSHGGLIVLKPFYERKQGKWVSILTGAAYEG